MVEVFKTNVTDQNQASILIDEIHKTFVHYIANFDLEDCDHILRVKCDTSAIEPSAVINLLKAFGYYAEVLQDDLWKNKSTFIER